MSGTELFQLVEFVMGVVFTLVSAVFAFQAIRLDWRSRRGDTFLCAAVITLLFGLTGTIASIAEWVDYTGRPGWYCAVGFLCWVAVVAVSYGFAIRAVRHQIELERKV